MWAVSWTPKGSMIPRTSWHESPEAADAEVAGLRLLGVANVVAWWCGGAA